MLQRSIQPGHLLTSSENNIGKHWIFVAGDTITANQIVRPTGISAAHVKVEPASASSATALDAPMFVAMHGGSSGDQIRCAELVLVGGLNTSGSTIGNPVYLSNTAGSWALTAGTNSRRVGIVVAVSATLGAVLFQPGARA